jgi:nicotinamide riboside kinase
VPWQKDNLRDRPNDRDKMFRIFEQQLIKNKAPYTILEGSKQERLTHAIAVIDTLIKQKQ